MALADRYGPMPKQPNLGKKKKNTGRGSMTGNYTVNPDDPYGHAFGPQRPEEGYRDVPSRQVPSVEIHGSYVPIGSPHGPPAVDIPLVHGVVPGINIPEHIGGTTLGNPVPKTRKTTKSKGKKTTAAPTTTGPTYTEVGADVGTGGNAPTDTAPGTGGIDMKWLTKQLRSIYGQGADPKEIAKLAGNLARQAVQAQVAGFMTQQQQLQDQGRSQALNILAASRAAANLQNVFGTQLNTAYRGAAADQRQIASGYAGDLQQLAQGEAADIAQQVKAAGGTFDPVGGNVPQNAFNALYGLQGAIPATALADQAVYSMKAAQALPMVTRGGGTQAALLAQGAANQASNALLKNIANAKADLPRITQQYVSSLTSAATAGQKNKLAGLALALNAAAKGQTNALSTWKAQTNYNLQVAKLQQNATRINSDLSISSYRALTSRLSQQETARNNRIRAKLTAGKQDYAIQKDFDKVAKSLAADIQDLVLGTYTKPTTSSGVPVPGQLINEPQTPKRAMELLFDKYPSLSRTKAGRELIIGELQRAYGPLRAIRVDSGVPIIVGWPKSGDFEHYPISAFPSTGSATLTGLPGSGASAGH